ncbi:sporulation related protein [Hypnocyclicus thermotrophus]|uniref:Sporulation related protein n=1 Tax=Hypnocyclicus thermotrophus TaxID=1627895 RepID=A0AA46DYZ9_9FUSO|nr:SPOR domain-containing protein [Hypnocyclicus thermotrophus]TDT71409.1 sporulation related protein [Hypnocyclicus thermotrophus]
MKKNIRYIIISITFFLLIYVYISKKNQLLLEVKEKNLELIKNKIIIRKKNFFLDNKYYSNIKNTTFNSKKNYTEKKLKKSYYLQIGTYSIEENAIEMQKKLSNISNFIIIKSPLNNNYNIVISSNFKTREDAELLEKKVIKAFPEIKPLIKMRY